MLLAFLIDNYMDIILIKGIGDFKEKSMSEQKLKITDIRFGKIDAHNELQEMGEEFYLSSFLEYDKYKISSFLNGENFFVCGNKGTGKTALLKYLECKFSEDTRNLVLPIRFKTQFDSIDKKRMRSLNNNIREDVIEDMTIEKENSYILTWQVFIINQILKYATTGEYVIFRDTPEFRNICKLLAGIYSNQKGRLVPKLSKGYATINASTLKGVDASIKMDIEFDEQTKKINFNKTAKVILNLYDSLEYDQNPVYILIDELELSVKNKKEFKRDIELVRDLIMAVEKMNSISKKRNYNIKIIASVRSEVINNVLTYGYEINKCIEDFGVNVEWFQKGGSYEDSPLLRLIESKIYASEKMAGIQQSENVWKVYFAPIINGMEVRKYILSYSWQRPRDVIRMMRLVQDQWNGEDIISQEMFDRALQKYSENTWNEIAEELVLSYPHEKDLQAIKKFFTGIEVPFTFAYLNNRAKELGEIYDYINVFFEKYKMIDFLEKMFEWGIIGNSGQRMVFKFLGDRDLSPVDDMILHKPLRNFFAVKSRRN